MTWLIVRSLRMSTDRMATWLGKLGEYGFETYYPMIRELGRVPQRKLSHHQRVSNVVLMRPRVVPFLPQLVFVRMTAVAGRIADQPGVMGFLCVGAEPAQVHDALITNLRRREMDGVIPGKTPAEFIFSPGDEVELNGPLGMVRGKVDTPPACALEDIDADTKLRLTIDIFGRATRVIATVADVRKV
jgi:transcription antitermination factor NusG